MTGDPTTRVASALAIFAVLTIGTLSIRVESKRERMDRLEVFRETSPDHGLDQVKREFRKIHAEFTFFADQTGRLPNGSVGEPESELRKRLSLSMDDLTPPIEWSRFNTRLLVYVPKYLEPRCDGRIKPARPAAGERDVWITCDVGGMDPSKIAVLWSDGKIEVRDSDQRLAVRRGETGERVPVTFAFGDETGVPLVFRTLEQRRKLRSYLPFRRGFYPVRPIPPDRISTR